MAVEEHLPLPIQVEKAQEGPKRMEAGVTKHFLGHVSLGRAASNASAPVGCWRGCTGAKEPGRRRGFPADKKRSHRSWKMAIWMQSGSLIKGTVAGGSIMVAPASDVAIGRGFWITQVKTTASKLMPTELL